MYDASQKKDKKKILIIILSIGIVICIALMIWALFFRTLGNSPNYAPYKLEPNAQVIETDNSEKLEAPSGGVAISLQYEDKVTVSLFDKKEYLDYSNPNKSTQNIVLEIVIKDQTIAKSGLIKPGYQITELPISDGAEELFSEGVYNKDTVFKILSYDPDSGEKAVVDTKAEITVTVIVKYAGGTIYTVYELSNDEISKLNVSNKNGVTFETDGLSLYALCEE